MKPPLYTPFSIFFLLVLLFISINVPTSLCADDPRFTNCNNTNSCGEISNIRYPFWGLNRETYCGQPELELICESNIPKLTINSVNYRILAWNPEQQNLTVARDDYWDSFCPSGYRNSTFDLTKFKYIDGYSNMTLFYQCNSDFGQINSLPQQQCTGTSTYFRYSAITVDFSAFGYCTNVVVIPIFGSQVGAVMGGQIDSAIKNGFGLEWILDNEESPVYFS